MANNNTKTYVDEQRLQQYVDAAIEMYKKMYPSWSEEELNEHIQRNVHDQVNEVTDKIDEINTEIDKYQDKLDQLPEDVTERLVNAEGQIVILNADKNKLTDDIQIITTEQNGLKERCTTVETLSRQIETDVQAFKSEIESKSYVESYDFEEFKTNIQESSDRFSTDIETTKGDVSKINQELETNYITKEESKDFVTGEQIRALEETTSKTLTEQRGIIDTVTGTMKITSEQQNKLELEVNTFKYDFTNKYNEINNSHQNLVSNIEATYVPKTAIKFDKDSQELTISDVSIPLKDVNINAEGVVEEVEDVKNTVNDAIPAIADALKPSINGDDWISVEEGGSESTYEAPYFKSGKSTDSAQQALSKIKEMSNQSVNIKFNESKIDEKITSSLSDMLTLSDDINTVSESLTTMHDITKDLSANVEDLKDAIKELSANECSSDFSSLSSDVESLKDAIKELSANECSCDFSSLSTDIEDLKDAIKELSTGECSCDLESLTNDLETLETDVEDLKNKIKELSSDDSSNDSCSCDTASLSSDIEKLKESIEELSTSECSCKINLAPIYSDIRDLYSKLSSDKCSCDLASLSNDVNDLKEEVSELRDKLTTSGGSSSDGSSSGGSSNDCTCDLESITSGLYILEDAIIDLSSKLSSNGGSSNDCACDLATLSSDIINALSTSNSSGGSENYADQLENINQNIADVANSVTDTMMAATSITGDDWINVEEGASESTACAAPFFKARTTDEIIQQTLEKLEELRNKQGVKVKFNESKIDEKITASLSDMNALSSDVEFLKDAIKDLSANDSSIECTCDLESLTNDIEDLKDAIKDISSVGECSCDYDSIVSMVEDLADSLQNSSSTLKAENGGIVINTQIATSEDGDSGDTQYNIELEGFSDSSDDSIELTSSAEVEKETISLLEGDAFLVRSGSTLTYKTISLEIPLPKDYSSDIDDINARLDAMDEYCNHDHTHECDPYIYERLTELAISCEHECDSEIYERLDALESELDPEQPTSLLGRINENSSRIDAIESELNLENNEGLLYRVNENTGRIEDNIRRLDDIEAILIDNGVDPSIATRLATLESIIEASGLDVGEINSVLAELKNDNSLTKGYIANINAKNYEQDDKFSVITAAIEVFSNQIASLEAEIANIKTKLSM